MDYSVSNYETLLPLLLIPLLLLLSIKHIHANKKKELPLPPGPKPWPILGNIPHMTRKVHLTMSQFAKSHGPLISVKLGAQLIVVASSPAAAAEILKTHDRVFSARYINKSSPFEVSDVDRKAIVWASTCNDSWKSLRGLCRTELFSGRAIESQAAVRERKVGEMVEFLAGREGKVVDVGEIVFATVFNSLCNLFFSEDLLRLDDSKGKKASGLKGHIWKMMELATTPNIADFYPVLEPLDPQGLKKKTVKVVTQMFSVWESYIRERREIHESKFHGEEPRGEFLDVFLSNGFDDDKINWLFFELLTAGTETTSTTVEWAMAELLKNGEAMSKVRGELNLEIGENTITESNASQLTFLNACIKETFRLHPPVPFLIPRRAPEACQVMNYRIPKDCLVLVNVWAIGRDPSVWEDPLSFRPERFVDNRSAVADFKGRDFELLPFGSGRRICPGLPMAAKQLPLILTSLIKGFDWTLPGCDDPAKLDMSEKFGLTLQKEQPLLLVARKQST